MNNNGRRGVRWGLRALLVCSSMIIAVATLSPTSGAGGGSSPPQCYVICGSRGLADFISNIVLFVPFGLALGGLGLRARRAAFIGLAFSLAIEFAQLSLVGGRDATTSDVVSNTMGALIGGWIGGRWGTWTSLRSPRAERYLAVCAAAILILVAATGRLLLPEIPSQTLRINFTRGNGDYAGYPGKVLDARIRGEPVENGTGISAGTVDQLLAGAPFALRFEAVPPERRLRRIAAISAGRKDMLILGSDERDLLVQYRSRASSLLLDEPTVRLENVLPSDGSTDTIQVTLRRGSGGFCVSDGSREACPQLTAASSWMLMRDIRLSSEELKGRFNIFWMALMLVPVGFFFRRRWLAFLLIGLLIAGLALLPRLVGLYPAPLDEWLGGAAGLLIGFSVRRVGLRLVGTPADSHPLRPVRRAERGDRPELIR